MKKNTKIVCTLGPASETFETLSAMVDAGMNVVRLNFSHGTHAHFLQLIALIKKVSKAKKTHIAILQDLQGPKIRIGKMPPEGIDFNSGDIITLDVNAEIGDHKVLPLQYKALPGEVKRGDIILINDGLIETKVISTTKTTIKCRLLSSGNLTSNKGINVPTALLHAPPITEKDKTDLAFGLKHKVDYVALSFVRHAKDITDLKKIITKSSKHIPRIIAKIERKEAIEDMENIIAATDGIMVARGDLGLEIPAEQVPMAQKSMIALANKAAKPVITATQMLHSMVSSPTPSRAEVSDIANAVLDKTDAVMLSNESAVGEYPIRAVQVMNNVAHETEILLKKNIHLATHHLSKVDVPLFNATCSSAVTIAENINAKYIVAITNEGFTAQEIAKHRPSMPIIALSPTEATLRRLSLVWGVQYGFKLSVTMKNFSAKVPSFLKKAGLIKTGDELVICNAKANREDIIVSLQVK